MFMKCWKLRASLCPQALILFLSSAAVYGDPETLPITEIAPTRPLSPYGFHKLASELALREYCKFTACAA